MSSCRTSETVKLCFKPNDTTVDSLGVLGTYSYDHDGVLFAVVFHLVDGTEIDVATYLGGGQILTECSSTVLVEEACVRTPTFNVLPGTFDIKQLDITTEQSLHWVYNSTTGLGYPGGAPIPGPNPSPVSLLDIPAVQALLDAAFGAGHVGYTIDPTNPNIAYIYGLTATCVTDHQDLFWWGDATNYTHKDGLTDGINPVPAATTYTYRVVEAIKTVDGSTVTVVLYEKDGSLIDPQPDKGDWTLGTCQFDVEYREVCTAAGEMWQVIGRVPSTGDIAWTRLEDINGVVVPGPIVDCVCPVGPVTPALEARNTYTGSGIQSSYPDKWNADCGPVTWTVEAFKNGALQYTSPVSPALTSATAAQTWLNTTGGGGYVLLNAYNDQAGGVFAVNNWSLPAQADGDWLIVITENAGNQCVPICYGFANYDIQNNGNGNPTGWWDTIGGTGLNPTTGPINYPWQIG